MKRSVILTLCIILCLALSLGGTIAYLSDADGDVNVMTLGHVKIELEEYQRDEQGGLEKYENDRMILPMVGEVGKDEDYGLPTNPNFHDKIVRVVSDSSNADAYLRVWIGVPSALLNVVGEQDAIHLVRGEGVTIGGETVNNDPWPWFESGEPVETTIEKISYTMFCYEYTPILTPGDVTPPVLAGLYLDKLVDNRDGCYILRVNGQEYPLDVDLSQGLQIPVLAQAVQAAGFPSAKDAFESAEMNDLALFDEYLDLKEPIEKLTEQVEELIKQLAAVLSGTSAGNEPYKVELAGNDTPVTYDLNGEAAAQMNAIADTAENASYGGKKEVRFEVDPNETVTVNLGDADLADNIVVVNEGGELIINGN